MTKHELGISMNYVPDWGIIEAMRELFQNALDNQTRTPENQMYWNYDKEAETITVGNKTSVLERKSLLIGESTKRNEQNTIGKHGEGYKLAFVVLIRQNKKVTVYNYGAKEVWRIKVVKSRKYGCEVPVVEIDKQHIWNKIPDNNLTITVEGITEEEYKLIENSNLHLKYKNIENNNQTYFNTDAEDDILKYGMSQQILFNKEETGNIYVNGLYVGHLGNFFYGYNLRPTDIKLDRDRKMLPEYDVKRTASRAVLKAMKLNNNIKEVILDLVKAEKMTKYADLDYTRYVWDSNIDIIRAEVISDFEDTYGSDAIPVRNNENYKLAERLHKRPVFIPEYNYSIIEYSSWCTNKYKELNESKDALEDANQEGLNIMEHVNEELGSLKKKIEDFVSKYEYGLNDEQLEELEDIGEIANKLNMLTAAYLTNKEEA